MSRKHFEALAADIKSTYTTCTTDAEKSTVRALACAMCKTFAADNGRFDADRFLKACGIN